MGGRAVDRTTGPSENACTCISVERVLKTIVVIQSVIIVTEIVTVPAARALIAPVRCVTHRVFQQRGKNGEVDANVSPLSSLVSRVASVAVNETPCVIVKSTGGRGNF